MSWRFVDIDGVEVVVTPVYDGALVHWAEYTLTVKGEGWLPRCALLWMSSYEGLVVDEAALPTCLWCITDRRRT